MFENENIPDFYPLPKLVEHYCDFLNVFVQYKLPSPFLSRRYSLEYLNTLILIIPVWRIALPTQRYSFMNTEKSLNYDLKSYFGSEFLLFFLDDLQPAELKRLSYPSTPSLKLTPNLTPETLRTGLIATFGTLWLIGQLSWVKETKQALQENIETAKTELQAAVHKAVSYRKLFHLTKCLQEPSPQNIITHITILYTVFDLDLFLALCEFLKTTNTLQELCLSHNNLDEMHAAVLCSALEKNTSLTHLDISHNRLRSSIGYFFTILETNTTLTALNVGSNNNDSSIKEAFMSCLEHNRTLTFLGLSACLTDPDIQYERWIEQLISQGNITALDVSYNHLSTACLRLLMESMIYSQLKLSALDLSGNTLEDDHVVWLLAKHLHDNSELLILKLNNCVRSSQAHKRLTWGLSTNHTLTTLESDNLSLPLPSGQSVLQESSPHIRTIDITPEASSIDQETLSYSKQRSSVFWREDFADLWKANKKTLAVFLKEKHLFEKIQQFYQRLSPYKHTVLFKRISELHRNTSLRDVTFRITFSPILIPPVLIYYLTKNTTLEKIKIKAHSSDKESERRVNAFLRRSREKIVAQRKDFIFILISLNSYAPWRSVPWDVQKIILSLAFSPIDPLINIPSSQFDNAFHFYEKHFSPLLKTRYCGKVFSQLLGCADFVFHHMQECREFIKARQKITILEKQENTARGTAYRFRFFRPSEEKIPVAHWPNQIGCKF